MQQPAENAGGMIQAKPSLARRILSLFVLFLKAVVPLAVVAAGVGAFVFLKATKPEIAQRAPKEQVWPVQTVGAGFAEFQPTLERYGEIVAGRQVQLRSLVAAQVVTISPNMQEGAIVSKGEELLSVDRFDYDVARDETHAQLQEAQAALTEYQARVELERITLKRVQQQLELAMRDVERAKDLVKKGAISEKTVDDRELTVIQRRQAVESGEIGIRIEEARVKQHKAKVERLEGALQRADRNVKNTTLVAPFDALISEASAELGRYLSVNDTVATLIDADKLDVRLNLADSEFGRIVEAEGTIIGRPLTIIWNGGAAEVERQAIIERVGASISASSGGVDVYARITNPKLDTSLTPGMATSMAISLRPGAFVEVRVPDRKYTNVVRVPETALYGGDAVYAVVEGRLEKRPVLVVGASGTDLFIRGEFKSDEEILITRLSKAGEGLRVSIVGKAASEGGLPSAGDLSEPGKTSAAKKLGKEEAARLKKPARSEAVDG